MYLDRLWFFSLLKRSEIKNNLYVSILYVLVTQISKCTQTLKVLFSD
jgi:hypothetical protein